MPCVFAGDINIDLLKYEINHDTTDFVNGLLVRNFLPTILMPTRTTDRTATIIDHIYYYEGTKGSHCRLCRVLKGEEFVGGAQCALLPRTEQKCALLPRFGENVHYTYPDYHSTA